MVLIFSSFLIVVLSVSMVRCLVFGVGVLVVLLCRYFVSDLYDWGGLVLIWFMIEFVVFVDGIELFVCDIVNGL